MKTGWSPLARLRSAVVPAVAFCMATSTAAPQIVNAKPASPVAGSAAVVESAPPVAGQAVSGVKQPLAFEANNGQAADPVRFVARGEAYTYFLTPTEAVLIFDNARAQDSDAVAPSLTTVRMRFSGSNPNVRIVGQDKQRGVSNYLRGSDANAWVKGVERYSKVRYENLYPGIDLVFYEHAGALEYDFIVSPGADPERIQFALEGTAKPTITADGSLTIATEAGTMSHRKPRLYQIQNGERVDVAGGYRVDTIGNVSFRVPPFDMTKDLVIDPQLTYSSYLGGAGPDRGNGIDLDKFGDIFIAGRTISVNYPVVGGVQSLNAGNYDVFVSQFDPTGATLVYSTYIGGLLLDTGQGIAVTDAGDVIVAGYTLSANFPTVNAHQAALASSQDAFLLRLNAAGDTLLFSTYYGGDLDDNGNAVAIDSFENAWIVGRTTSTTLVPGSTIQNVYQGGPHDAFVAKFSDMGVFQAATYLGGIVDDAANAVAVDFNGDAYITGQTSSPGFPIVGGFQSNVSGGDTAFITKIDSAFTGIVYSTFLGGTGDDVGTGIAVDAFGNAYVSGYTQSLNFPANPTPIQGINRGSFDAFVTKVNPAGNARVFSTYLGGTGDDRANAIAVDQYGSVYVVGQTRSTNYPIRFAFQSTNGGNNLNDAFVTKLGATGRVLIYSTYLGGATTDIAYGVTVDFGVNAFVTGYTDSTNYPLVTPFQNTKAGVDDVLLSRVVELGDTPGIVQNASAAWFLRNSSTSGPADIAFTFGASPLTTIALAGDWNGDGISTPGLYDMSNGTFFLRNFNTSGSANATFVFGSGGAGIFPVVGDWNNDGVDTIGLFNSNTGTWFLKNSASNGNADIIFSYGAPASGFLPITGDWNGDGIDTIGLFDPVNAAWFLRNTNSTGVADNTFFYGFAGGTPLAGDWNADGIDTVGLYQAGSGGWFLTNTNAAGPADNVFVYGPPGATPIVGDWNR